MSQNSNSIGLNDLVDYQKKTYSPYMDKVMKFLWKCAGADPQILQYSPYSDHVKNAGIGGVVLATSVMAGMAMGFAMHTIFASPTGQVDPITKEAILSGNWFITIPISLIWGLIIFNLDRFIVSTVKGDGTEKITKEEFWAMLPRLVMAIIIGLTISAPLETYIFKKEIIREWDNVSNKMVISRQYEIEQEFEIRITEVNDKILKYDSAYVQNKRRFDALTDQVNQIQRTECDRGANCPRHGEIYKNQKVAETVMNSSKVTADSLKGVIGKIETDKNSAIKIGQIEIENRSPGFLDQLMMLEGLSSHGKEVPKYDPKNKEIIMKKDSNGRMVPETEEIYGSAFWPIWLVRLLFMIIEIAPVIFKFMIWKSSYDYMQDNVAQILEAKQGISLEYITDENNNLHKVRENYNARRIIEVSKRQNELEKENAIHAITLFAEKEREEIETDPGKFIKSDSAPSNLDGNEEPVVV